MISGIGVGCWLVRKAIFLPIFSRRKRKADLIAGNLPSLSYVYPTYIGLFTNDDITVKTELLAKKAQENPEELIRKKNP